MKTMLRKAAVVLLLGLAVHGWASQSSSAQSASQRKVFPKLGPSQKISDYKYKYIITPKPMDSEAQKHSVVHRYKEVEQKYNQKLLVVDGLRKKTQEAQKNFDEKNTKVNEAKDATQSSIDQLKMVLLLAKKAHEKAKETLQKEKDKMKPQNGCPHNAEGWEKQHQKDLKIKTKDVEQKLKAKMDLDNQITKQKGLKIDCEKYWTVTIDEAKHGWSNDWKKIYFLKDDKAKVAKLKPWAKDLYNLNVILQAATEEQRKAEDFERRYEMEGDMPKMKDGARVPKTPEDGGLGYWKQEMGNVVEKIVGDEDGNPNVRLLGPTPKNPDDPDTDLLPSELMFQGVELLGFFGDVHGSQLLIGSELEIDQVKELFEGTIAETPGHKEEKYMIAEVKVAKKDAVPTVSVDNYLRIKEDVSDHKNHGALILTIGAMVETVHGMERKQYKTKKNKDGLWEEDRDPSTNEGGQGKLRMEKFEKKYLNMQAALAVIYVGYHQQTDREYRPQLLNIIGTVWQGVDDLWTELPADLVLLQRESKFDVAGDWTNMSDNKDVAQGSDCWKIVAIIFIVIVGLMVLGGLVYACYAYNGRADLQNIDI